MADFRPGGSRRFGASLRSQYRSCGVWLPLSFYADAWPVVGCTAAGVTVLAAALIVPALPWLLGFAAGAMLYVVAAELLPTRGDSGPGALAFAAGFTVMMILDVALG